MKQTVQLREYKPRIPYPLLLRIVEIQEKRGKIVSTMKKDVLMFLYLILLQVRKIKGKPRRA